MQWSNLTFRPKNHVQFYVFEKKYRCPGVTKIQFQESQNWDVYWQCSLYSSLIGQATAQYHYFKRTNNLALLMSPKKSIKISFVTPGSRGFSVFAQSISQSMLIVTPVPQNQIFFEKQKNHANCKTSETSRNMPKLAIRPATRGL